MMERILTLARICNTCTVIARGMAREAFAHQ